MKINNVTEYVVNDGVAVVTIDSPPVNALSSEVRAGIRDGVEKAINDADARAIVLACAGRTFHAGADIREFGKPVIGPTLREVQMVVEDSPKPVVVAIHGTALGGGLELALVAHFRVAVSSARLGLPEVNLGLIPGAGGTQRLPRIVGVDAALEMICLGKSITAGDGLACGLIDEIVAGSDPSPGALAFARRRAATPLPLRKVREQNERLAKMAVPPDAFEAFRARNAKRLRDVLAPEFAIRAIEAAVSMPFVDGMVEERRLFQELAAGPQSLALRHVFFAEREAAKMPGVAPDTPTRPLACICIVGAGLMGGGIAMNFLNVGQPVTIIDATPESLERGIAAIRRNYEMSARKGKLSTDDVARRMGLLTGTCDLADAASADLVIEAVFEQMDVKKDLFRRLDAVVRPGAILASNTSYLDLDEIASVTSRADSVVGLHFFSPANVMRLVEVVRGAKTAKDVLATGMKLAKTLGKVGVLVGNGHGFVGNRMLAPRQREADKLVLEGALPWDVDRVLVAFGFPMGPFQMRDMAGMDLGWDRRTSSSSTVREILNEMGRHGQKSAAGYYDYDDVRRATPSAVAESVILELASRQGVVRRSISDQEILERCLYPMVNEGARILAEGKATRASDIDIIWVLGYGWPAHRGGPMHWAGEEGIARISDRLDQLAQTLGDQFRPAPLLAEIAASGGRFV